MAAIGAIGPVKAAAPTPITEARTFVTETVSIRDDTTGGNIDIEVHLDSRYRVLKFLGSGAYGVVLKATDTEKNEVVAIKVMRNVFGSTHLGESKRIYRELLLLRQLGGHHNVMWVQNIWVWPNQRAFTDVYIVMEYMRADLAAVIQYTQVLTDSQMKYLAYQVLCGLKWIHAANALHRDLKPQNILVNTDCSLKITDFGLGRAVDDEDIDSAKTAYVQTRWYRAPELLCNYLYYDCAIDVWSAGCVIAELLIRRPLFAGHDWRHQLRLIVKLLGTPTEEDMWFIQNQEVRKLIMSFGVRESIPWSRVFPRANPQAVDLIDKLLKFNPAKRMTVDEALDHPYLAEVRDYRDERVPPRKVSTEIERLREKFTKQELQTLMLREMAFFHPVHNSILRLSGSEAISEAVAAIQGRNADVQLSETAVKEAAEEDMSARRQESVVRSHQSSALRALAAHGADAQDVHMEPAAAPADPVAVAAADARRRPSGNSGGPASAPAPATATAGGPHPMAPPPSGQSTLQVALAHATADMRRDMEASMNAMEARLMDRLERVERVVASLTRKQQELEAIVRGT